MEMIIDQEIKEMQWHLVYGGTPVILNEGYLNLRLAKYECML
jgi:hypothetical protein